MTWEHPYAVDGATLKAETLRVAAYAYLGEVSGIVDKGDCKVTASAVPDANIHIGPGAVLIPNDYNGGGGQAYAAYQNTEDVASVTATAGASRSDLVVVRIVDPQFDAEQPLAGQEDTFDYARTHIVEGVPANTKDVDSLNLGYPAVALARIDRGASTGIVTSADIVDLRKLARPRSKTFLNHVPSPGDDGLTAVTPNWEWFPNNAIFTVEVPKWAVRAKISGFVEGLRLTEGGQAALRAVLVDTGDATEVTQVNEAAPGGALDRRGYNLGGEFAIPSTVRGTTVNFRIEAHASNAASQGMLRVDAATSAMLQIVLEEQPT